MATKNEETEEEFRKLIVEHGKKVTCPRCKKVWLIPKYQRKPAKRLLAQKCPYCNPYGITIKGES